MSPRAEAIAMVPDRQQVVVIAGPGGPEMLKLDTRPVPRPKAEEVLIRVEAAGVNRHDCNQRRNGAYHDGTPVPGLEVAGTVAAVGRRVAGHRVGDRVMALVQGGGYAEFAVAGSTLTMPMPETLDSMAAAALPEALFTTWWNFFGLMGLRTNEFALIHGGTSGVGHIALQAMSALGYRVIATCGTAEKVAAALGFGALAAFSYKDAGLAEKVMRATDGIGIAALLDMSAGAHAATDLDMMADDGRIAHLSGGGGANLCLPLMKLMQKRIRVTGSLLRPLDQAKKAAIASELARDVLPLLGQTVRPHIATAFPLREAAAAHRELERGAHIGKIMLRV